MLKWNNLSLRNQFLIIFVLIQLLILGLIFIYFTRHHTNFYLEQLKISLRNESRLIVANDKVNLEKHSAGEIDRWVKKWGKLIETRITIVNKNGRVLADSNYNPAKMDNHGDRPEIKRVLVGWKSGSSTRRSKTLDREMFYLATPIQSQGEISGAIRLSKSLTDINQVIKKDIRNYLLFMLIILIVTFLIAWKFTFNLINPLSRMTEMAGKIASGNLQERIQLKNYQNEIGVMARMFNFMADQLEHKLEEISEEKNKAEAILSSMVDGVIATDINREIILANPAAKKLLKLPPSVNRKDLIEIVRHYRIDKKLMESLEKNKTLSEEISLNNPEKKIFRCHFAPITDEHGSVIGGVIVFTDITELRRLEQVRKDFVANVSHELRTPLTSIIGYVDTLLESEIEDSETSNRFLRIIKTEADRLSLLIKDLLNLSRFENDNPKLKPGSLERIIDKTLKVVKDSAREKNITIRTEVEDRLPFVMMIPEQIEQVLINLVDNSIKYTPDGGKVIIRAHAREDKVLLEVEDNGIGIPEKDQERIFERFYRVDKARSRALGGTGIGLSIVKHIIKGHNSGIEIDSMVGEGTTFRFYLYQANHYRNQY